MNTSKSVWGCPLIQLHGTDPLGLVFRRANGLVLNTRYDRKFYNTMSLLIILLLLCAHEAGRKNNAYVLIIITIAHARA